MDNIRKSVGKTSGSKKTINAGKKADLHRGKTVEYFVRRNPAGISEISRRLCISRRTLYNWFENEKLNMHDIIRLGFAIDHDFSNEFLIEVHQHKSSKTENETTQYVTNEGQIDAVYFWMEKYIQLLEQYNEILNCKLTDTEPMLMQE